MLKAPFRLEPAMMGCTGNFPVEGAEDPDDRKSTCITAICQIDSPSCQLLTVRSGAHAHFSGPVPTATELRTSRSRGL